MATATAGVEPILLRIDTLVHTTIMRPELLPLVLSVLKPLPSKPLICPVAYSSHDAISIPLAHINALFTLLFGCLKI